MNSLHRTARNLIGTFIFMASSALVAAYALAAPTDYRFELVSAQPAGPASSW